MNVQLEQLFDGCACYDPEYCNEHFCDCKILKEFGPFKSGDVVSAIFIDYAKKTIEIYDESNELMFEGKLEITIIGK